MRAGELFSEVIRLGDRVLIKPNLGGGNDPRTWMTAHLEVMEEAVMVVEWNLLVGDRAWTAPFCSERPSPGWKGRLLQILR